jgi:thiol-disulfide isomerase/thioredoxin
MAASDMTPWTAPAAPALALDSLSGGRVDVADLCGRVVLVHFFATWCEPCREEMTALETLASRASDPAPAILAVDVGEVEARVRSFFATQQVSFPVLLDRDRAALKAWNVQGLPTTFVLDRALRPSRIVEGDLNWADEAVGRELDAISQTANATSCEQQSKGG